jgi:hypothetical protein
MGTETRSPELHGADNHEIVRVHDVREDMISLPADHVDLLFARWKPASTRPWPAPGCRRG